ncbi:hypothetical protein ACTMTJ_42695 [Phytohabitans sp. LJ34]|uniref:hypothetical protein n=1 Tax=Phytohabitans sp. LJ34 TaxID=3452217 RepID=UPI003F890D41
MLLTPPRSDVVLGLPALVVPLPCALEAYVSALDPKAVGANLVGVRPLGFAESFGFAEVDGQVEQAR